jgi:hypothetical protein
MLTVLAIFGALGLLEILIHHGAIRIEIHYPSARKRNTDHVRER